LTLTSGAATANPAYPVLLPGGKSGKQQAGNSDDRQPRQASWTPAGQYRG